MPKISYIELTVAGTKPKVFTDKDSFKANVAPGLYMLFFHTSGWFYDSVKDGRFEKAEWSINGVTIAVRISYNP